LTNRGEIRYSSGHVPDTPPKRSRPTRAPRHRHPPRRSRHSLQPRHRGPPQRASSVSRNRLPEKTACPWPLPKKTGTPPGLSEKNGVPLVSPKKRRGPPLALVGDRDPLAAPGAARVFSPLPLPTAARGARFRSLVSRQPGRLRRRRPRSRASRLSGSTRPRGERPGPSRLPWWRCRPWVQRSPRRVVRAGACGRPLDPSGWCRASLDHSPAPPVSSPRLLALSSRPVCSPCSLALFPRPRPTPGHPRPTP
jgi:hypothetical protein